MASSQQYLLPGQPLPSTSASSSAQRLQPSSGTYARSDYTLSSLIGQPSFTKSSSKKSSVPSTTTARVRTPLAPLLRLPDPDSLVLARVTRLTSRQAVCSILLVLPDDDQDDGAAAGTLSLSQALASGAANHAAGEDPSGLDFSGVIRQQDVRLTETDKVKVGECFRVGDLVRAKVISLGDSRSYFLSTASNDLGVVFATASVPSDVLPSSSSCMLPSSLAASASGSKKQQGSAGEVSAEVPGALRPLDWQTMVDPLTGKKERRKVAKPQQVPSQS